MSKAPERIYLDGDAEAGDGMFPRCFENPKYASEPQVEYVRADLAAAQLATCEKYRDAYAECDRIGTQAVRDLEAKLSKTEGLLAKAVEAMQFWSQALEPDIDKAIARMAFTLAELKGQDDE